MLDSGILCLTSRLHFDLGILENQTFCDVSINLKSGQAKAGFPNQYRRIHCSGIEIASSDGVSWMLLLEVRIIGKLRTDH